MKDDVGSGLPVIKVVGSKIAIKDIRAKALGSTDELFDSTSQKASPNEL